MKVLDFSVERGELALVTHLYKILVSDQEKVTDRLKIKQMARILDLMEEHVKYETVPEGTAFMLKNAHQNVTIKIDTADFDVMFAKIKGYQPTIMECRAIDKLFTVFERAEETV